METNDLASEIRARPWQAVGLAALAGALAGAARRPGWAKAIAGTAMSALGAFVFRTLRNVAIRQIVDAAQRSWTTPSAHNATVLDREPLRH